MSKSIQLILDACDRRGCASVTVSVEDLREVMGEVEARESECKKLAAERDKAKREFEREDEAHGVTIDQRDRAAEAADALAYALGSIEEIGEHSNLNCPWANALEIACGLRAERDKLQREVDRLQDLPLCRRQFPDGSVPGNTEEALAGWHRIAEQGLAFKTWTHAYLDTLGVPAEFPDGPHTREGCRIGDRMDWWRDQIMALRAEVERLREDLTVARACKPDEYEMIRSCERAAQESRFAAERERDRLAAEVLKLRQQVEWHAEPEHEHERRHVPDAVAPLTAEQTERFRAALTETDHV